MPEISPPPPTGTIDRVGVRRVLFDLEADGAGAGDHERVVERVDAACGRSRSMQLVEPLERARPGRSPRGRRSRRSRASPRSSARTRPATSRRARRSPSSRGRERDGLRVVAGADRDHAARASPRRVRLLILFSAPRDLERAGALEELALQACAERRGSRAAACAAGGRRSSRARARRRRGSEARSNRSRQLVRMSRVNRYPEAR